MNYYPELTAGSTILVVDDTPANLSLMSDLLKDSYQVRIANRGERALEIARSETPPDLILLDVLMPELDGYEICRRLKADTKTQSIPVIFITAMADAGNEGVGLALGAVDYIAKPFNKTVVKARIRIHLQLQRQSRLLESMAFLDALTEIPNRRALDLALEMGWKRGLACATPLSYILMDIDQFKQFNDHYGHGFGDECLVRVAQALQQCAQHYGHQVGRYGGEEFAVVLADTETEQALRIAQALHDSVAALQIPHARSAVAPFVTISSGVATIQPDDAKQPQLVVEAADTMLYEAKDAGKNTTCSVCL